MPRRARAAAETIRAVCGREGASLEELQAGSRRGHLPRMRAVLARELVVSLGFSLAATARHLGVSTSAIAKILRKSRE